MFVQPASLPIHRPGNGVEGRHPAQDFVVVNLHDGGKVIRRRRPEHHERLAIPPTGSAQGAGTHAGTARPSLTP